MRAVEAGVKVGLGSDVAGGVSPSMLQAMRAAVLASKAVAHAQRGRLREERAGADEAAIAAAAEREAITYKEAFWLATEGGAAAVGLAGDIGALEGGRLFDAIVVDAGGLNPVFDVDDADTLTDRFQKFINLGEQVRAGAPVPWPMTIARTGALTVPPPGSASASRRTSSASLWAGAR